MMVITCKEGCTPKSIAKFCWSINIGSIQKDDLGSIRVGSDISGNHA